MRSSLLGLGILGVLLCCGCDDGPLDVPSKNRSPEDIILLAEPRGGTCPVVVDFTAFALDPDGSIESYRIDFGDGSPPSDDPVESHSYPEGTFTAVLTVTDDSGAVGRVEEEIDARCQVDPVISFEDNVVPLFTSQACVNCHGNAGGLTLTGTPAEIHDELWEEPDRVVVADPPTSLLLTYPTGADGHPVIWATSDAAYITVLTWIQEGALEN